jgi:hypothetical protein
LLFHYWLVVKYDISATKCPCFQKAQSEFIFYVFKEWFAVAQDNTKCDKVSTSKLDAGKEEGARRRQ